MLNEEISIETEVQLNKFKWRPYQLPLLDALENKGFRRACVVWPRRAGKEVVSLNFAIRFLLKNIATCFIIYPTFNQGRRILWQSLMNDGTRFLSFIPPEIIETINETQMLIRLKNQSVLQVLGSDNYDCFDDKTEILTEDGWKLFKDVSNQDKVATLKDGYLVYEKPIKRVEYEYDGVMFSGKNSSIDFLVTPNHRFWVRSSKGIYKFKNISEETIRHDSIPSTSKWEGQERTEFVFPVIKNDWICGKGRHATKSYDRKMPMEDFVALLGIFLAEGSTYSDHKTYRISISQTKANVRAEIISLLERLNINYQAFDDQFTFEDKQLYQYFSQFGKQDQRFIPKDIKALSSKYLKILFEWLIKGDGHTCKTYTAYYSISKRLIDDVQEIIIKLGLSGNIYEKKQPLAMIQGRKIRSVKPLYEVRVRKSKFKRLQSSKKDYISTEHYKGKVYCVSVPSGVIKVRRNGKELWSGNSLVGVNCKLAIFSEFALQDARAYQYLRPVLTQNQGTAIFISTPRGHNHFFELYEIARTNPDHWYTSKLTVEDTGHIPLEEIERERQTGELSDEMIAQEYFTSFDMGIEGSYYCKYIDKMKLDGRIGSVPYEAGHKVHSCADLGVNDSTFIIFFQCIGQTVRLIDCYENSKVGLEHYMKVMEMKGKAEGWVWGKHFAPHDIAVKEWGSGMTRLEKAKSLGFTFQVTPNIPIEDGIEALRSAFSKMWIDETKCKKLIKCLENYHQTFDHKRKAYSPHPYHDWSSNGADAARYLALNIPKTRDGLSAEELDKRYIRAMYGEQSSLPPVFRDDLPNY